MRASTYAVLSGLIALAAAGAGYAFAVSRMGSEPARLAEQAASSAPAGASSLAAPAASSAPSSAPSPEGKVGPRATAEGTVSLEARLGHARLPASGGETYVALLLRGADAQPTVVAPAHLALVIDRSGSMRGSRIKNAIEGAAGAVERLRDGDTASVVTFDTRTEQIVARTVIDASSRKQVVEAIRAIKLGGDTCISCGIDDALKLLGGSDDRLRRIILLSDGEANHGVRDVPGFRVLGGRAREAGVQITTVGVDVEYNDRVMTALAMESNGRHHFVENDASLPRVFQIETEALLSTVGAGAEIELRLAPGVTLEQVYARAHRREGSVVRIPVGVIPRGDTRAVVARVKVPAGAPAEVVAAQVRYRDQVKGGEAVAEARLGLEAGGTGGSGEAASELDPWVGRWLRGVETAAAVGEASELYAHGKLPEAIAVLDGQIKRVKGELERVSHASRPSPDDERALREQLTSLESTRALFQKTAQGQGGLAAASPQMVRANRRALRLDAMNAFAEAGF